MGKIYYATFETLKGDMISVDIYKTGSTASAAELELDGKEPVVIEYNQDSVFDTLKTSSCSVGVITDAPMFDLYTGQLSNITIEVTRNDTLIWFGMLSPNVYSMPYDSKNNKLTLEFVCPITAMEDVKFKKFGDNFFASFTTYITQALSKVGASSMTIEGLTDDNVGCMQRNFIDETEDEDDGAMTWREVLDSIMRYLNKTACCYGDKLCVYDALETKTAKSISELGVAGSSGSVSLGEVYNKVTVVANNNPLDNSIPDPLDDSKWESNGQGTEEYHEEDYYTSDNESTPASIHVSTRVAYHYKLMNAAYKSSSWKVDETFRYKTGTMKWGPTGSFITEPYTYSNESGVRFNLLGSVQTWEILQKTNLIGSFFQRYSYVDDSVVSKIDWKKCLTLPPSSQATLLSKPYFVGNNGYFVLSMKFIPSYWVYPQDAMQTTEKAIESDSYRISLECQLNVGDKYLYKDVNGNWAWGDSQRTFTVYHLYKKDGNVTTYTLGSEVSIENEVSWTLGLNSDKEGACIPLPSDYILHGEIGFKVKNYDSEGTNLYLYRHITELSLTYTSADTVKDIFNLIEYDADVKYSGNIVSSNIKEADDVDFLVNTYTSKATSYSYAISKDSSGVFRFVESDADGMNAEKRCIERMVNYYSSARMSYEITLNEGSANSISPYEHISASFLGKTFTVGGVTYNLADNSAQLTLLEV